MFRLTALGGLVLLLCLALGIWLFSTRGDNYAKPLSTGYGNEPPHKAKQTIMVAAGMSREQYIAYLQRLRTSDSLEIERRIQAVKDRPVWP
jgi:hypothetical protein